MNGFEVYREYVALRAHFQGKYDYQKYGGRMNLSESSYNARRDRVFFDKLAKSQDPRGALVATFVEDTSAWIQTIAFSPKTEERRLAWAKRVESLSYLVKEELNRWHEAHGPELFDAPHGVHPPLLRGYIQKAFSLETLTALLDVSDSLKLWNERLQDDPTWRKVGAVVERYRPFLKYDREKLLQVMKND